MSAGNFDQHQLDNDFRQACSLGNLSHVQEAIASKTVDVNVADKYEQFTGLHMACEHGGHYEIVEYLLQNNANVNCQNSLGETPIVIALKLGKKKDQIDFSKRNKIVQLLLSNGADLSIGYSSDIDSLGKPKAIHCAVILGDVNILRKLLFTKSSLISCLDALGRYPIHYASKYNKILAMQELLALGSQLEPTDNEGYTPFHVACDCKHIDAVQFILDQGGHMHTKTANGDQALHISCRHKVKSIVPIVEFLISQGADQDVRDSRGKCLKDYIKENILLRNVISNAKKKATKYANHNLFDSQSQFNHNSLAILDLKGQRLYSSSGYKIDAKNKKLDGSITLYEHGLLFSFKKGFISKSTIEEFYPWNPSVDLVDDANDKATLLRVEFGHETDDEEKKQSTDKFGIIPCRAQEITETIRKEINKMYPTYALQSEMAAFVSEKGIQELIDEHGEVKKNMDESVTASQKEQNQQLMSEINTMNARLAEIENKCKTIWNEAEHIMNQRIEPLITELCCKIDAMILNNEHWKLISNVRESLSVAKEYKKQLIRIRTQIRPIVFKLPPDQNDDINYSTV
eukprot:248446_1